MQTVDTRGHKCPAPIIMTKKVLKEVREGESFIVLTDNQVSFNNLTRFLYDNKTEFKTEELKGEWRLLVTKGNGNPSVKEENFTAPAIPHFEKGDFIIVISSDKMGEGDDELGKLLIVNFIKAVKDMDKLPVRIVLYNKGVTLAARTSPVIGNLIQIEKMGVEILLCATCVNYYKLENETGAGILSNMFTIAEAMASAGKIIKP
jgi:selenium metabolism protein YedF